MAKNGHSEFFLTIFPKNPKIQKCAFQIYSTFLVQKDWYNFGMAKRGHSEFIQTFLVQIDWKKLGMAKIRHSKFIQICSGM